MMAPAERDLPIASSSSMKMMQGALVLACSKRSRTRAAPTPTNISTNSDPEIEKNGTPASPATARASRVFPVPGRAHQQHAFRNPPAQPLVFFGILQEIDNLPQLALGLLHARHVAELGIQSLRCIVDLRAIAAEAERSPPPFCIFRMATK